MSLAPRPTPSRARLALAGAAALAMSVSACSGEGTPTAASTDVVSPAPSLVEPTDPAATSGTATPTATSTPTPSTPPSPAKVVKLKKKVINVGSLGHKITVTKVQRNWPWPKGYEATASAFELIAVEMTWVPGTTYTATVNRDQFSLLSATKVQNLPDTLIDRSLKAKGYKLLPKKVANGKKATGWMVFKVEPRGTSKLTLRYDRPKSIVTPTNNTIPAKTYTLALIG